MAPGITEAAPGGGGVDPVTFFRSLSVGTAGQRSNE